MTQRHDDPALLTGSWATDALSEDERREFEAALAESPDLRAEADSLAETARALAYAVESVAPPASLKASLMAAIQTTPQAPAAPAAPARHVAEPSEPVQEAPLASVTSVTSGGGAASAAARRRWFQRPAAFLGAVAAVGVVCVSIGLGAGGALFGTGSGPGPSTSQAASGLDQIYAAPDFARKSASVSGGGKATVVWSDQLGKSAVILDGVKAAPKDKTYELWYIGSGGTIESAGLMNDVDGGVRSAVLSGSKSSGATIGITVEPAGGSKQPTTTPIVAVPTGSA
ncbi:anti-sigma factor domain-containing protein [Curtobacterium sp. VKM Ac-2922]|uniref:anti-sigma factor n=1 Tax=Curtobacterium sp. VKM Ac-2922 TaxID=2929475 RepID=UPI001FB381C0|nr:anti-sigma factor [Curtobacterium sp. VKM Ac-2922]MCJ1714550.1 anti-sigma factor [Curtobacterium sp. VKM Ac-2922]